MKSVKIAAMVLVAGAGLLGSYLMIKGAFFAGGAKSVAASLTESIPALPELPAQPFAWAERLKEFIDPSTRSGQVSSTHSTVSGQAGQAGEGNLTRIVAQSLFGRIQALDQSGNEPFGDIDPDDAESRKLLEQAVASLGDPGALFAVTAEDAVALVSDDASLEAKKKYLEALGESALRRTGSLPKISMEELFAAITTDCVTGGNKDSVNKKLADSYRLLREDYQKIPVPSDWLAFHKNALTHYRRAELVFGALADCFNDPVRGQIASQALSDVLLRAGDVQGEYLQKRQEMKL
ncbi:hypothetical protein HY504_00260 [Candidatus Wolfebacteria bacterium]|nr:hypothetical protein [Candidatus Wolfebacteria bacterium]